MKRILVTYRIPQEGLKQLYENFDVMYPEKPSMTKDEVMSAISEFDGMIAAGVKVDREIMDAAQKLKIISNYGVGYDNVDVEYATKKGIVVANTPHAVTEATAEIAFGLMLSVMRRISDCDRRLRGGELKWGMMNNLGHALYGKTLGIVGMGRIGRAVARRAAAFGMNICYHNRNRIPETAENSIPAVYKTLDRLLEASDVISINTPLTSETYHLIGDRELGLMKRSAFIINTSRGAVIDEQALIGKLREGKIAGAGLDVFEKEPLIPVEMLDLENVVITPHIGTEAVEARIQMAEEASVNIIECFKGARVSNIVNPEVMNNQKK
jgi:D-3-phosphoglycerate dehydrogenase